MGHGNVVVDDCEEGAGPQVYFKPNFGLPIVAEKYLPDELTDKSAPAELPSRDSHPNVIATPLKKDAAAVLAELDAPRDDKVPKLRVAQIAPAVFVSISEEFGLAPGVLTAGQLVQALKACGFDHVFDLRFAADITIMEEGSELVERLHHGGPFPMITSCCAGWMLSAEKTYPKLFPNISSCKSPMSMSSALVKTYVAEKLGFAPENISITSIMPCTLKKQEAKKPQLAGWTDYVLTVREIAQIMRARRIRWESFDGSGVDAQFSSLDMLGSGAGQIFGVTGGVMEAAIRTAYEIVTHSPLPAINVQEVRGMEGAREATLKLPGFGDLRVCVIHGSPSITRMMEWVSSGECPYHFIEVMMCVGGCINGPGQPKSEDKLIVKKRIDALYTADERMTIRKSHENEVVKTVYKEFLKEPLSEKSHELMHTHHVFTPLEESFSKLAAGLSVAAAPLEGVSLPPTEVTILFGSETGNSENVAHLISNEMRARGVVSVKCTEADDMDVDELPNVRFLVIVISTAGQGELPENSKAFWENLVKDRPHNFLENTNFAVFGLGDSAYPFFCRAAQMIDARLGELGARRFLARGVGNDQDADKFETGLAEWTPDLWDTLKLVPPTEEGDSIPEPKYNVILTPSSTSLSPKTSYDEQWRPLLTDPTALHFKLVSNTRITSNDYDRDARHIIFDLEESPLKYSVGDALAIFPRNDPSQALDFLKWYGVNPCDTIQYKLRPNVDHASVKAKPDLPSGTTVHSMFVDVLDVFGRPTARFYESLVRYARDPKEQEELRRLIGRTPEGKNAYKALCSETVTFADVLRMFPSCKLSLAHLIELIPVIKPRYYSIASSSHMLGAKLELSIVVNDWKTPSGKYRIGLCTDYIRKLNDGIHYVAVALKPSVGLFMPFSPVAPIVMAGLGTGLAPMRAMVQERNFQVCFPPSMIDCTSSCAFSVVFLS